MLKQRHERHGRGIIGFAGSRFAGVLLAACDPSEARADLAEQERALAMASLECRITEVIAEQRRIESEINRRFGLVT